MDGDQLSRRIEEAGISGPAADIVQGLVHVCPLASACIRSVVEAYGEAARTAFDCFDGEGKRAVDALAVVLGLCSIHSPGQAGVSHALVGKGDERCKTSVPNSTQYLRGLCVLLEQLPCHQGGGKAVLFVKMSDLGENLSLSVSTAGGSFIWLHNSMLKDHTLRDKVVRPGVIRDLVGEILRSQFGQSTAIDFAKLEAAGLFIESDAKDWAGLYNHIVATIGAADCPEGELVSADAQ